MSDREELFAEFTGQGLPEGYSEHDVYFLVDAVLTSAWLAAHDAETVRVTAEKAAQVVEDYVTWKESDRRHPADRDPTDREALVGRIRATFGLAPDEKKD